MLKDRGASVRGSNGRSASPNPARRGSALGANLSAFQDDPDLWQRQCLAERSTRPQRALSDRQELVVGPYRPARRFLHVPKPVKAATRTRDVDAADVGATRHVVADNADQRLGQGNTKLNRAAYSHGRPNELANHHDLRISRRTRAVDHHLQPRSVPTLRFLASLLILVLSPWLTGPGMRSTHRQLVGLLSGTETPRRKDRQSRPSTTSAVPPSGRNAETRAVPYRPDHSGKKLDHTDGHHAQGNTTVVGEHGRRHQGGKSVAH